MIRWVRDVLRRTRLRSRLVPEGRLVAQLDVRARQLADALTAGPSRSLFKGRGLEPRAVRRYEFGDDARALDWRVTARRGDLHVRDFEEERDLEVLLLVDRSASLFGLETGGPETAVLEIAAALAHVAARGGHRVGLLSFSSSPDVYVRPARRRNQTTRILGALLDPSRGSGTDLGAALTMALRVLTARGLVVVISDFDVERTNAVDEALIGLRRRHEVVPVVVRTPRPADLPPVGPVRVRDPETGRLAWVDTGPAHAGGGAPTVVDALRDLQPVLVDPRRPLPAQLSARFGARARRAA